MLIYKIKYLLIIFILKLFLLAILNFFIIIFYKDVVNK